MRTTDSAQRWNACLFAQLEGCKMGIHLLRPVCTGAWIVPDGKARFTTERLIAEYLSEVGGALCAPVKPMYHIQQQAVLRRGTPAFWVA